MERTISVADFGYAIKRLARLSMASSPYLSTAYYYFARDYDGSYRGLRQRTEIVIDAFPRCANSFFARRIIHAQPPGTQVAHHTHAAGILTAAVRRGLPTVTILREPRAAIVSFAVYLSSACGHVPTATWLAMREYVAFHKVLLPIVNQLAILLFEDATSQFADCVDAVNRRLGVDLQSGQNQPRFDEETDAIILAAHRFYEGAGSSKGYVARKPIPDRSRTELQARFRAEIERDRYARLKDRAQSLYEGLRKHALVVGQVVEQRSA